MAHKQPRKIHTKAAVILVMLWLGTLSIMAYLLLLSLNDMKVDSSNLSKEDGILKHTAKILQQLFLSVPTQDAPSKEHSTTIHSEGEHKIKETTLETPGEILEETPVFLTFRPSRSNKMKPEVPLIQEPVLETKSSIQHPKEQDKKGQERIVNIAAKETPDNKNTDRELDNSSLDNMNLEDDDNSVLGTEKSGSEEDAEPEHATVEKAVLSALELPVKLTMDYTQESSKKMLEKLIRKPFVKVTPKPVPKAPGEVRQKASLDSALKLIEEAFQQVKKKTWKKVILGQMALVTPSAMDYQGTQVHNLERGILQLSEESKEQPNKEQMVEDQVLKKISNINTELKHELKNAKQHIEFNNDVESAKKYTMQNLSLLEGENPSSNGHKPQKLTKGKTDDERIRLFINFLYDFKPQLNAFLNMGNIPPDLRKKATTIFSIMEGMLCGNQQKKEGKYH